MKNRQVKRPVVPVVVKLMLILVSETLVCHAALPCFLLSKYWMALASKWISWISSLCSIVFAVHYHCINSKLYLGYHIKFVTTIYLSMQFSCLIGMLIYTVNGLNYELRYMLTVYTDKNWLILILYIETIHQQKCLSFPSRNVSFPLVPR